jgi:hypothetical protein
MWLIARMDNANEDDNLPFLHIAAATANVLQWLKVGEKHQDNSQRKAGSEGDDVQNPERNNGRVKHTPAI